MKFCSNRDLYAPDGPCGLLILGYILGILHSTCFFICFEQPLARDVSNDNISGALAAFD